MNKDRFWSIVDATRLGPPVRLTDVDFKERNRLYEAALAKLVPQEILDFRAQPRRAHDRGLPLGPVGGGHLDP